MDIALISTVHRYSGGAVTDRVETNQKIIKKIEKELERRNVT
ncbi:hypothetical protein LCGC14_2703340 [marine sediment metagenome]|uniref:Uncharacterized protein n=1 Tax=marine sediment metagenome TaxID=412755 RepID=A0A0F9BPB2_9ZZZZ